MRTSAAAAWDVHAYTETNMVVSMMASRDMHESREAVSTAAGEHMYWEYVTLSFDLSFCYLVCLDLTFC